MAQAREDVVRFRDNNGIIVETAGELTSGPVRDRYREFGCVERSRSGTAAGWRHDAIQAQVDDHLSVHVHRVG